MKAIRLLLVGGASALLAACITIGTEKSPIVLYKLNDRGGDVTVRPSPIDAALAIIPVPGNSLGEAYSVAYSRGRDQRVFYQFASWTDRPSLRIAQMVQRRLERTKTFASVGQLGNGLRSDLLLNIYVDDLFHDVSSTPGSGKAELTVELLDRGSRALIARQRFRASSPAGEEDASGGVEAISRSISQVIDQLVPWLDKEAAAWLADNRKPT